MRSALQMELVKEDPLESTDERLSAVARLMDTLTCPMDSVYAGHSSTMLCTQCSTINQVKGPYLTRRFNVISAGIQRDMHCDMHCDMHFDQQIAEEINENETKST